MSSYAQSGPSNPKKAAARKRRPSGVSPSGGEGPGSDGSDHDGDAEEEEDNEPETTEIEVEVRPTKRKKGAMTTAIPLLTANNPALASAGGIPVTDYRYTVEIGQMLYVFGEVVSPLDETSRVVEDIVRGQVIELLIRARSLSLLRSSRFLSADDLLFLIRSDRSRVNRLRNYLSWKDVRKKVKAEADKGDAGDGGGEIEEIAGEEGGVDKKPKKATIKLPWELLTPFTEFLRTLPSHMQQSSGGGDGMGVGSLGVEDDEDEDDEELEAYEDSLQRLRDADILTRRMTKEEYMHFSDCRQASFTFRKAKRFREFLNFTAYLDLKPNDDIMDILGFLAFEMVRELCVVALALRDLTDGPGGLGFNINNLPSAAANANANVDLNGDETEFVRPIPALPLQPHHIMAAYKKIQREAKDKREGGMGMANWRGGVRGIGCSRGKVAMI